MTHSTTSRRPGWRAPARVRPMLFNALLSVGGACAVCSPVLAVPSPTLSGHLAREAIVDSGPAVGPPNIVMLLMDDLDVSVWQNALERGLLPRIQAEVIDHGTTFDNMFVAESMCCPSRATFLTGEYPHNHGVLQNGGPQGGFGAFKLDGSTIATSLHAAGYRTALLGKYLNGYGLVHGQHVANYVPPGWDYWRGLFGVGQFDYDISVQGTLVHRGHAEADYQEDVLTGMALEFLNVQDARPVFLALTPTAPHYEGAEGDDDSGKTVRPAPRYADTIKLPSVPPESLPSFNEADMSDKPAFMQALPLVSRDDQRAGFNSKVAAIRAVDDMLGAVVDSLRASGRLGNTLIIITSDNGYQYGSHRRLRKTDLYEESIRVPMVIHAPGQITPRRVADSVMNLDWAPTIVDYAAAQPATVFDGMSLRPLLQGGSFVPRKTFLVEHPITGGTHPKQYAVRSQDPSVTGDPTGQDVLVFSETLDLDGIMIGVEFYDLAVDPYQLKSLHENKSPRRQNQMRMLQDLLASSIHCVGSQCLAL